MWLGRGNNGNRMNINQTRAGLEIYTIHKLEALKFGSEACVLKKREELRLEAAQSKVLRHLLRITNLDKEKNQCIRQKTGAQNIVKEIEQYQKTGYNIYTRCTQILNYLLTYLLTYLLRGAESFLRS